MTPRERPPGRGVEAYGSPPYSREGRSDGGPRGEPENGEISPELLAREDPDRLVLATLRVRMPRGPPGSSLGTFSRRHPGTLIEVLNRSDVSARVSVSDHWIEGRPAGRWTREIAGFPEVLDVDCLAELGEGALYRITFLNPPVIALYQRLGLPLPLPVRVQAGVIHWEVAARAAEFRHILEFALRVDPETRVVAIRRRPLRDHLPTLSEAQGRLLTAAMSAGYFAVPKGCSLTDLARQLGRSKSTISEAMAVIERKLIESALRPASFPSWVAGNPAATGAPSADPAPIRAGTDFRDPVRASGRDPIPAGATRSVRLAGRSGGPAADPVLGRHR